jgi:hypothetical protein
VPNVEITDVGVAGLWRLLERVEEIRRMPVVIAVAGMDAALPTVLGGLVGSVVIGVPTSVGYGVAAGGDSALKAMLASCAPGLLVMNIDNGRVCRLCRSASCALSTEALLLANCDRQAGYPNGFPSVAKRGSGNTVTTGPFYRSSRRDLRQCICPIHEALLLNAQRQTFDPSTECDLPLLEHAIGLQRLRLIAELRRLKSGLRWA